MPCHSAMIEKPTTISPDETVEKVLKLMKKKKVEYVPVVDGKGVVQGLFSYEVLLKNLLPVSLAGSDGLNLGVTVRAAPGIAKRLKKVEALPVADFMKRKVKAVFPETPIWEGVNHLVMHGPPLLVVENESGKLVGLITGESILEELQRIKDSEQ